MAAPTVQDLDRCPHGRHRGDACAGYRGPGVFDGGCQGGYSIGNPWPYTGGGDRIGTTVYGQPILTGDLPAEGRPRWMRARFHADPDDFRPVKWPPPGPYWRSGFGLSYSTMVAWLRPGDEVTDWWPEASAVDCEQFDEVPFSARFPRPGWWSGCGVGDVP